MWGLAINLSVVNLSVSYLAAVKDTSQWRNIGTITSATLGATEKGAPNFPKMWETFVTLTARLAKSRVLVDNSLILKNFERHFRIKSTTLKQVNLNSLGVPFLGYFFIQRSQADNALKVMPLTLVLFQSLSELVIEPARNL